MRYARRLFLFFGCVGSLSATPIAKACAIPWAKPVGLDNPDAPKPTTDPIGNFLDAEFGRDKWQLAGDEKLIIETPRIPETNQVIPIKIFLPGGDCSRLLIFLESHVPYRGQRWSQSLLSRTVESDEIRSSQYLMVRRKILTFIFPKTGVSEITTRIRAMRADYVVIVAAESSVEGGKKRVFVRQSTLAKELAPHCGGAYFVDTQHEAETTSCYGGDSVCPGDSWGAR